MSQVIEGGQRVGCLLLGQLPGSLLSEHRHRLGSECDQLPLVPGLGLGLTESTVARHQGPSDRHPAVLNFQVTPGETLCPHLAGSRSWAVLRCLRN